jgi:hypothetical protein
MGLVDPAQPVFAVSLSEQTHTDFALETAAAQLGLSTHVSGTGKEKVCWVTNFPVLDHYVTAHSTAADALKLALDNGEPADHTGFDAVRLLRQGRHRVLEEESRNAVHSFNEMRDRAHILLGRLAEVRNVTVASLYSEFELTIGEE